MTCDADVICKSISILSQCVCHTLCDPSESHKLWISVGKYIYVEREYRVRGGGGG